MPVVCVFLETFLPGCRPGGADLPDLRCLYRQLFLAAVQRLPRPGAASQLCLCFGAVSPGRRAFALPALFAPDVAPAYPRGFAPRESASVPGPGADRALAQSHLAPVAALCSCPLDLLLHVGTAYDAATVCPGADHCPGGS